MTGFVATEPGFLVRSPCGREWFVPRAAIRQDYINFLMEQDKLAPEVAAAQVDQTPDFLETWFAEQCNCWGDIEALGRLVTQSTLFKTKKALDRVRGSRRHAIDDYEVVGGDWTKQA